MVQIINSTYDALVSFVVILSVFCFINLFYRVKIWRLEIVAPLAHNKILNSCINTFQLLSDLFQRRLNSKGVQIACDNFVASCLFQSDLLDDLVALVYNGGPHIAINLFGLGNMIDSRLYFLQNILWKSIHIGNENPFCLTDLFSTQERTRRPE